MLFQETNGKTNNMKIQLKPFEGFQPSKHRNAKQKKNGKSLTFVDAAGKPIKGDIKRHYREVINKQQDRFQSKFEAFSLLKEEELKELYINPIKPQIQGNTDKLALRQSYFNIVFERYKTNSKEELIALNTTEIIKTLNEIEKRAFEAAFDIKNKEEKQ